MVTAWPGTKTWPCGPSGSPQVAGRNSKMKLYYANM